MRPAIRRRLAAAPLVAALLAPGVLRAQGVVINGSSSARFIDLRPLALDSVLASATQPDGAFRRTPDGVVVTCVEGDLYCRFQRPTARTNLVALLQDLDVTGWGLGRGISVHAQLRARAATGGGRELWPQATERVDAVAAYLEIERDVGRARLGRQWLTSSLGVFNFDGATLRWRALPGLTVQGYAGWTLLQGLDRPVTDDALAAVENLPPDERGRLFGGDVALKVGGAGMRAQYQREIGADRGGLYQERLALDGEVRVGPALLNAAMARDLASGAYNELRVRFAGPFGAGFSGGVEARHYLPFFALWTIWGAFAPVGFDEARADLHWRTPHGALVLDAFGGRRRYAESDVTFETLPLRTDGWRLGGGAAWRPVRTLELQASYGADVGFGAARSDADAAIRWAPGDGERLSLALRGAALQNIYEFRVGTGRVVGFGGEGALRLGPSLRAVADAMVYRHTGTDDLRDSPWNQRRGGLRLEWTFGTEAAPPGGVKLP